MAVDLSRLTKGTMNVNAGHERTARIIHQIQLIRGITVFQSYFKLWAGKNINGITNGSTVFTVF
jgi:hypothetical protein